MYCYLLLMKKLVLVLELLVHLLEYTLDAGVAVETLP